MRVVGVLGEKGRDPADGALVISVTVGLLAVA